MEGHFEQNQGLLSLLKGGVQLYDSLKQHKSSWNRSTKYDCHCGGFVALLCIAGWNKQGCRKRLEVILEQTVVQA